MRVAFEEGHKTIILLVLPSELQRHPAPPVRLKREDGDARVVELFPLFCHSNAVEPAKHFTVGSEFNNRDVLPAFDFGEQTVVSEQVSVVIVNDRRTCFPCPPCQMLDPPCDDRVLNTLDLNARESDFYRKYGFPKTIADFPQRKDYDP